MAMQHVRLRIFDVQADVRTDCPTVANAVLDVLGHFHADERVCPAAVRMDVCLLAGTDNAWHQPVALLDGEPRLFADLPHEETLTATELAYCFLLQTILTRVRSHVLIHAGAVSSSGQGVTLIGGSGQGKSTLVLELVRRGFKFLSDEVAALGRGDGLLHPFPRSLQISADTLDLVGLTELQHRGRPWADKLSLDIRELGPGSLGQAVPLAHVIVLSDEGEPPSATPDSSGQEMTLYFSRISESMVADIRGLAGTTVLGVDRSGRYPTIRVRAARWRSLFRDMEDICQRHGAEVVSAAEASASPPDFDGAAQMVDIPTSEAVKQLLKRFIGGSHSEVLKEEHGGRWLRLYMELARLLSSASCHRLTAGSLASRADLVCSLLSV